MTELRDYNLRLTVTDEQVGSVTYEACETARSLVEALAAVGKRYGDRLTDVQLVRVVATKAHE